MSDCEVKPLPEWVQMLDDVCAEYLTNPWPPALACDLWIEHGMDLITKIRQLIAEKSDATNAGYQAAAEWRDRAVKAEEECERLKAVVKELGWWREERLKEVERLRKIEAEYNRCIDILKAADELRDRAEADEKRYAELREFCSHAGLLEAQRLHNEQVAALEAEVERLTKSLNQPRMALHGELSKAYETIDRLRLEKHTAEEEVERLRANDIYRTLADNWQTAADEWQKTVAAWQVRAEKAEQECERLQTELAEFSRLAAEWREKCDHKVAATDRERATIDRLRQIVEGQDRRYKEVMAEVERLNTDKSMLEAEYALLSERANWLAEASNKTEDYRDGGES